MKLNLISTYSWGQHYINWIGYHKYYNRYGLLPSDKNFEILDIWYDLACSCGWCYTFENIVFVCEKPSKIHLNNRGQLSKDRAMALEYSDGYGLYMLNGINVPKWLVETKAGDINPKKALEEKNVDIQREIIRKIGADRLINKMKEVDTYTDSKTQLIYKLMKLKINDNVDRKYLYFKHASIKDVFYCQPVPPETVKALHGFAWMRHLIERGELENIDMAKEAEIIANLPEVVS